MQLLYQWGLDLGDLGEKLHEGGRERIDARKIFVSSYQPLHLHSSHSNLVVPGACNVSQP